MTNDMDDKLTSVLLDAQTFPLFGKRLIEASAGTGKTYTIANLYLRLLVPTRATGDIDKPLTVDQILVVTFTEAATAELKARIRQRIRVARKALMQAITEDDFLANWMAQMDERDKAQAIEKLLYAEKQMDEAAIFTIHGFCQRMLSQNAFESRMLFQQTIETDEMLPLTMAVKDVWRCEFYPLNDLQAEFIKPIWVSPDALLRDLYLFNQQPDAKVVRKDLDWKAELEKASKQVQAVKSAWLSDQHDIVEALNQSGIKRNFWPNNYEKHIAEMTQWAQSDKPGLVAALTKFDASEHTTRLRKGGASPNHDFFLKVQRLKEAFPTPGVLKAVLLVQVWQQVQERMQRWKRSTQSLTFTDLLTSLDVALKQDQDGQLAQRIRQLYPVAMIDEFQDTDAVQYRIFSTVYAPATAQQKAFGLIMIGDPKQAIYAFRGADIYTYLAAKQDVDSLYSLATNYRSSANMIRAVNNLFAGQAEPFRVTGIPFVKVQDRGIAGGFQRHQETQAAMQFLYADSVEPVTSKDYRQQMAQHCGAHLHQLLLDGQQQLAEIDGQGVRPKDIAILVTNFQQASLIKDVLRERGIASVYLSDKGSVFATAEAAELLIVLQAILAHGEEASLRTALATKLLDWSLVELDTLNHDDLVYEYWVQAFQGYFTLWEQQGLLPMLRAFMQDVQLAPKMLRHTNGQRRLTDFLHLCEKLQQKSLELESKEGVVRYLKLSIQTPNGDSDDQKIRLETDAELVRIVTVHKSKGLEYPIVYLPFPLEVRKSKADFALYHDAEKALLISPDPTDEELEAHKEEAFASDIRLSYVALTRSKEACYIGMMEVGSKATKSRGAISEVHASGLGSLVAEGETLEFGDLKASLQRLSQHGQEGEIELVLMPEQAPDLPRFKMQKEAEVEAAARAFNGKIERDWWLGSYSSLVVESHENDQARPGNDEALVLGNEASSADEETSEQAGVEHEDRFHFPKGAAPGTFLHDTLEGKALDLPPEENSFKELLKAQHQVKLSEYYQQQGFAEWQSVLNEWLPDMLTTELMPSMSLVDLSPAACRKELEFFIPVASMNALQLDSIARRYDKVSKYAPKIEERALKGMLKGFIDLLFEWQGKYYVLDYKSNFLGHQFGDYQTESLAQAIAEHRYDLQYQLYTLALHRLLKQRLPDYDYDKHIGGVFYLFLRGMTQGESSGIFQTRLSRQHVEALDELFSGKETPAAEEVVQYGLF
ncbi:exodeoxyribonuclease V subunit beta [Marinomonas epiphytica]